MPRVTHMQNSNTTMFDSRDVETHSRAHHGRRHAPQRKHSVRGRQQRDDTAPEARRVIRQHHSRSSNSCASQPLLRDYCRWQPQRPSNAAQCHTQQYSNTATQRHSDTTTQRHTTQQRTLTTAQCSSRVHTGKHAAPQLHTPLHSTLNVLITTVVTHNGGAALHTRPRPRAAASSAQLRAHNTSTTVLQSLPARTLQQCDTATATCTITRHVSH
jgi:hypothetical protein